jgi:hypothetical protein
MTRLTSCRLFAGCLALLLTTTAAPAQEPERPPSAIGTGWRDFGGYLELDMKFGDLMNEFAAFAGGRAAVLLKRRVYLGIGAAGLATDNARIPGPVPGSSHALQMGYGGLLIGYVIPTRSLVQITTDVLVGAGGLDLEDQDQDDAVFVFEPTVGVELMLSRVVRLGLGAGYRFVGDTDLAGLEDSDLRGFTGTAAVRVGWF